MDSTLKTDLESTEAKLRVLVESANNGEAFDQLIAADNAEGRKGAQRDRRAGQADRVHRTGCCCPGISDLNRTPPITNSDRERHGRRALAPVSPFGEQPAAEPAIRRILKCKSSYSISIRLLRLRGNPTLRRYPRCARRSPLLPAAGRVSGCLRQRRNPALQQAEPGEALSGGNATVMKFDQNAFSMPSANRHRCADSTSASAAASSAILGHRPCVHYRTRRSRPAVQHQRLPELSHQDGRGHPPAADAASAVSMLVRLSIPAGPEHAEVVRERGIAPEPSYGGQLQDMAIPGIAPEGKVRLRYSTERVRFADGSEVELRRPEIELSELGYGDMHPDTLMSPRIAPPMIGLGLLEAIPEEALLANADPDDRNGDGISGRPIGCSTRPAGESSAVSAGRPASRASTSRTPTPSSTTWDCPPACSAAAAAPSGKSNAGRCPTAASLR